MLSSPGEKLVKSALLVACVAVLAGCFPPPVYRTPAPRPVRQVHYVQPAPVVQQAPVVHTTTGYTPQYYNGYVVYFNAQGHPFYYLNSRVHYVPRNYVGYRVLVQHYRVNRAAYLNWYPSQGINFRALGVNIGL